MAFYCPDVLLWDLTGGTDKRKAPLLDFSVTIIDQNITLSSLPTTVQFDNSLDLCVLVLSYPTRLASILQETAPHIANQGYILAPCYQKGSHFCSYDHNSLRNLIAVEIRQCPQAYGSVSFLGSQSSFLQPQKTITKRRFSR